MTTVTVYKSTDASAPSLSGTVGSLLGVLDACLVNGYGSKSAAGWTKPYTNSGNVGCYKNSATDGTGFCLSVNDNAPSNAAEARMTGYQTLSAVATGTGQFPTSAQLGIGTGAVVCRKSATANSTTRAWTLVADDTVFYLFTETGDQTSPTGACCFMFGDIFSYLSSDPYRCMIMGRNGENTSSFQYEYTCMLSAAMNTNLGGHYLAGSVGGFGASTPCGKHADAAKLGSVGLSNITGGGTTGNQNSGAGVAYNLVTVSYPNPADGNVYMSPFYIHHQGCVRGYLKGLWCPLSHLPLNHMDTFSGTGALASKSFLVQAIEFQSSNTPIGEVFVETTSTWS